MRCYILLVCCHLTAVAHLQTPGAVTPVTITAEKYTVHCTAPDSAVAEYLNGMLSRGIDSIELFFGHAFPHQFDVWLFADRAALDRRWQQDWGDSTFHSECWMVASGVAHRLDILSPTAWATDACEHKASDTTVLRQLLCHELVHVYHGQHHPVPDFTGMEDLAWWIEGIAVYASGQMDLKRWQGVRELCLSGHAPTSLQMFWTGKHRYGLSGSLAAWLDATKGRAVLLQLLPLTGTNQILRLLDIDEPALLKNWLQYCLKIP